MKQRPNPQTTRRVTLRDVAALAGFSAMTVSCALRNSPKVLPSTREKVLKAAAELGYRPDPEISKLMTHLRQPSHHSFSHNLAFINSWPDEAEYRKGYIGEIYQGAQHRAAQLGFSIEPFWLLEKGMTPQRLSSILYNRGIRGILLPPWYHPADIVPLQWNHFSTVATTMSIKTPAVNRVVPNIFHNTLLACEELHRQGYRRLAYIETADMHTRTEGMARGAFELFRSTKHPIEASAVLTLKDWNDGVVHQWFEDERPDAIVCPTAAVYYQLTSGRKAKRPFGYIVLDAMQNPEITAIDQIPSSLGTTAVELLVSQIMHNESGLPQIPQLVLLNGRLRPGKTTPRCRAKPLKSSRSPRPTR
jgi:LacI family transcriptional regulator